MQRRDFLKASSALAALRLTGCAPKHPATSTQSAPALPFYDVLPPLIPIRADLDRIFRITVCLRPFRAAGPRLDTEKVGDKLVVHNYGHGGSGWSLSWGSGKVAVSKAFAAETNPRGQREIAVLGCGALGLTAAILAQRAGARVTIYCRERPPEVRSSRATGSWTPDSRIALTDAMSSTFPAEWESMARNSFAMYQSYLGMPGKPIEWTDRYMLADDSPAGGPVRQSPGSEQLADPNFHDFAHMESGRLGDLTPAFQRLPYDSKPFPTASVWRSSTLTFNVADYSRQLHNDFLIAGGRIETADFQTPADLAALPQPVIINCTGYGARALWSDNSIVPIRGQIAWLIPQPGVNYGFYYHRLNVVARRDGIVIQQSAQGEQTGWNDTNETPDHGEAEAGMRTLQELYSRMAPTRKA